MEKSLGKKCALVLLALLSSMSLAVTVSKLAYGETSLIGLFSDEVSGLGFAYLVVFVALSAFYLNFWDRFTSSCKWIAHLVAAVLSIFTVFGLSYAALDSWDFIFGSPADFAFALIVFAGYFVLFDVCLSCLYAYLASDDSFIARAEEKSFPGWIDRHYFLFAFLVICACWLPYLLLNYPGSVPYDGYAQLSMGTGEEELTNHHPWILSVFYGWIMGIGQNVSDNFGVFLVVLFGFVTYALCYAEVCSKIRKWGANRTVCILTVLFFAILPCFGTFAQAVWKDGLFSAFLALFLALYIDLVIDMRRGGEVSRVVWRFVSLFLVEMVVCIARNNGFYMMVAADVLMLFFLNRRVWKCCFGIAAVTLVVCLGYWYIENPMAEDYGVVEEEGSVKELLSVPFQQTARYLNEYPEDVTDEEAEAIDAVLPYETLADKYSPSNADPVKNAFRKDATDEELQTYFEDAWLPMFYRHPLVYIQSFLNNTYGYVYPFDAVSSLSGFPFYIGGSNQEKVFDVDYVFPAEVRLVVREYTYVWRSLPGLSQLVNPGTYTWILLIMGGYLCYEKQFKKILALAVPFLNICVCLISPVNGYLRYAMPLIACTPVVVYWCASKIGLPPKKRRKRRRRDAAADGAERPQTGTMVDVQAPASGGDGLNAVHDGGGQAAGYSRIRASGYGDSSSPVSGYGIRRPVPSRDGDRTLAVDRSDLASVYSRNQASGYGRNQASAYGSVDAESTLASEAQGGRYPAGSVVEQGRYRGKHVRSGGTQRAGATDGRAGSATGEVSS